MEKIEAGWYFIIQDGEAYPARFDGEKWHGKRHDGDHRGSQPIVFRQDSCPTGCTCTTNPDGTVKVDCSGGGG